MMYILLVSSSALMITWLVQTKFMWPLAILNSTLITFLSLNLLTPHHSSIWHHLSTTLATDPLSTPLMMLSCWLAPLSLIASMNTLQNQTPIKQRTFISLMFIMLMALIITFSSLELSLFFMAFETTLIPTLSLMARWGAQKERFQASMYFLFYTMIGSLPLLMAMMTMASNSLTTIFPLLSLSKNILSLTLPLTTTWWMFCLLAFTMKMPMYGFHLWLPKAHVEAPIAGSMMLAAILLKLGGYGLMRTMMIFYIPSSLNISHPLMTFCIWGALLTSMICLRQTDLKALMAYSSMGHMSIVASGVFSLSLWGMKGALTLMIAHGLMSSALFCLAKLFYERKNTRTLSITRGFKLMTPLLTLWWMITCVSNLGLPPTPNLIGELLIMSSMMNWKTLTTPIITLTTVFGAMYSLLIFKNTKKSTFPKFLSKIKPMKTTEHMLIILHLTPLLLLILSPALILTK